jgi:signal transduction histidine kinase
MNRLLAHLRKGRDGGGQVRSVSVVSTLESVVSAREASRPVPTLEVEDPDLRVVAEPDRLASVIEHLVQNAQDATPADGTVSVRLKRGEGFALIEVADTGCGMDAKFIADRLFRPFDTTKGNAGMGVGVYESREFVMEAGGEVDVESAPGRGTVFRVRLPLESAEVSRAALAPTEGLH